MRLGRKVVEDTIKQKITIPITGMHCASCASIINRTLKGLPGVEDVVVSFATEKASITYDTEKVGPSQMDHAIGKYGYHLHDLTNETTKQMPEDSLLRQKNIAITAFSIALVMFLLMMWDTGVAFFPEFLRIPSRCSYS